MYLAAVNSKPCLKWAGGKRELIPVLEPLLPEKIQTYFEPFMGGAALFWHLFNQGRFQHARLNDLNPELVLCYQVIKDCIEELVAELAAAVITKDRFQELRAMDPQSLSPVQQAARTIYLNRTCFNGLYRVNKKGQFNVPWGKYKNPVVLHEAVLRACHKALQRATLSSGSYFDAVQDAQSGDVVYFDPPYVPLTATSNFRSYTSEGFTLDHQKQLVQCFAALVDKGVYVLASNSDTPIVRELYDGFEQKVVPVRRSINSKASKRGPVNELIIIGRPSGLEALYGKWPGDESDQDLAEALFD